MASAGVGGGSHLREVGGHHHGNEAVAAGGGTECCLTGLQRRPVRAAVDYSRGCAQRGMPDGLGAAAAGSGDVEGVKRAPVLGGAAGLGVGPPLGAAALFRNALPAAKADDAPRAADAAAPTTGQQGRPWTTVLPLFNEPQPRRPPEARTPPTPRSGPALSLGQNIGCPTVQIAPSPAPTPQFIDRLVQHQGFPDFQGPCP